MNTLNISQLSMARIRQLGLDEHIVERERLKRSHEQALIRENERQLFENAPHPQADAIDFEWHRKGLPVAGIRGILAFRIAQ